MTVKTESTGHSPSLFVFVIGLTFLLLNVWSCQRAFRLKEQGASTQGIVTKTYIVKHRGSVSYFADYTIQVDGQSYDGSADITRNTFAALRPGSSMEVRYVPSNPSVSEAAEVSHSATTLFLVKFIGFPVSFFILFLAFRKQPQAPAKSPEDEWDDDLVSKGQNIPLPNIVKGIAFTMYPVIDMKRARAFYEGSLGLTPSKDFGGQWVEYHLWDNCFALTSMLDGKVRPSADFGGSIALEVQDVDDFVSQLKAKGVQVKLEPFSTPVCRMAVILDPEGNALTLHAKKSKN